MADLPQELIDDILLRLPAKSIGRFRCVSKPWRRCLSSPEFVRAHLNFHIHDPASVVVTDSSSRSPYIFTLTPPEGRRSNDGVLRGVICPLFQPNERAKLVGSCDGLVLLEKEDDDDVLSKFLMNPITLEAVKVPNSYLFVLTASYGLGYDSFRDDYKIVALSYSYIYGKTSVYIYSVKLKTWKRVANYPYDHQLRCMRPGIFFNGRLHWFARYNETPLIAAFDLSREEFGNVPPPPANGEPVFLSVVGGCVAMVVDSVLFPSEVWVMKEYGVKDSWTKLVNAPMEVDELAPVCLWSDEEIVFEKHDEKLVGYSLRNGVWRDIEVDGNGVPDKFGFEAMSFTESLVSPNYKSRVVSNLASLGEVVLLD